MAEGRFADKVAIVTGAGSGIGRAAAVRFAGEGARVTVADIREDAAAAAADAIRGAGGEVLVVAADVGTVAGAEGIVERTVEAFGRVDVAVNSAAIIVRKRFVDTTDAEWQRQLDTNVKSVFFLSRRAATEMGKAEGGAIVNISSAVAFAAKARRAAYCGTEGAVVGLTRSLALAFAPMNIRVNCVCPGEVDTPMFREGIRADRGGDVPDMEAAVAEVGSQSPIGRVASPGEIAGVVLFLASEDASQITGQSILPDGGVTLT
jgi:NAD(P)-dependent dehydrogenase (short-subunit alcohol dehydrogenase family)